MPTCEHSRESPFYCEECFKRTDLARVFLLNRINNDTPDVLIEPILLEAIDKIVKASIKQEEDEIIFGKFATIPVPDMDRVFHEERAISRKSIADMFMVPVSMMPSINTRTMGAMPVPDLTDKTKEEKDKFVETCYMTVNEIREAEGLTGLSVGFDPSYCISSPIDIK